MFLSYVTSKRCLTNSCYFSIYICIKEELALGDKNIQYLMLTIYENNAVDITQLHLLEHANAVSLSAIGHFLLSPSCL